MITNVTVFQPYTIQVGFIVGLGNKSHDCLGSTYFRVDLVVLHRGVISNEQCRISFFICVGFPNLGFQLQITPVYNVAVGVRLSNLKLFERKLNV
jgi:hypothetical protein